MGAVTPPMGLGTSATAAWATKVTPTLQKVVPVSVFDHAPVLISKKRIPCLVVLKEGKF